MSITCAPFSGKAAPAPARRVRFLSAPGMGGRILPHALCILRVPGVAGGGEQAVDGQAGQHPDAGIKDARDGIGDVSVLCDGEHHHKVHHGGGLDGTVRAEQEIDVNDAEEAQDQIKVPRQAEGPVCVQPVKRDHHQPAQQRAQKAVAAVAHALAPEAAHAEHRADAGKTGVAPAQQPVCRTDQQHRAQRFEDAHAHLRQRGEMK